ncbi:elongation factor P [bacterium]|nr:elongation factor P [bacterium]
MIVATQIRVGQILKINNNLVRVLKVQHITPGKGNAVIQTEVRNLKTNNKDNIRFRSAETVEQVSVATRNVNFLYQDGNTFHFMDPASFEQVEIGQDILEEVLPYLVPEGTITVSTYEGTPVAVTLPPKLTFEVAECDPPSKGSAGAFKDAKLINGLIVKVPLFIKAGDAIVVSTETGDYMEKG